MPEEVTKHSVHTLVFRSQKRAHEMFITDQGSLPDPEKDLESYIKRIKAESYYGKSLVERVNQAKVKKEAYESRPDVLREENPENPENPDKMSEMATPSNADSNQKGGQLVAFTGKKIIKNQAILSENQSENDQCTMLLNLKKKKFAFSNVCY